VPAGGWLDVSVSSAVKSLSLKEEGACIAEVASFLPCMYSTDRKEDQEEASHSCSVLSISPPLHGGGPRDNGVNVPFLSILIEKWQDEEGLERARSRGSRSGKGDCRKEFSAKGTASIEVNLSTNFIDEGRCPDPKPCVESRMSLRCLLSLIRLHKKASA